MRTEDCGREGVDTDQQELEAFRGTNNFVHPTYIQVLQAKFPHPSDFSLALKAWKEFRCRRNRKNSAENSVDDEIILPINMELSTSNDETMDTEEASFSFEIDGEIMKESVLKGLILFSDNPTQSFQVMGHVIGIEGDESLIVLFRDEHDEDGTATVYYPVLCNSQHVPSHLITLFSKTWNSYSEHINLWNLQLNFQNQEIYRDGTRANLICDGINVFKNHVCDSIMIKSLSSGMVYHRMKGKKGGDLFRIIDRPFLFHLPQSLEILYTISDTSSTTAFIEAVSSRDSVSRAKHIMKRPPPFLLLTIYNSKKTNVITY